MRAFLSDQHEGGNAPDYFAASLAADEARRILAETEPASRDQNHYTPADGWRYMSDVWLSGRPQEGNAHAALIESLAAFVSLEIR